MKDNTYMFKNNVFVYNWQHHHGIGIFMQIEKFHVTSKYIKI